MRFYGTRIVFAGLAAIAMSFLFAGALAAPPHAGDMAAAGAPAPISQRLARM